MLSASSPHPVYSGKWPLGVKTLDSAHEVAYGWMPRCGGDSARAMCALALTLLVCASYILLFPQTSDLVPAHGPPLPPTARPCLSSLLRFLPSDPAGGGPPRPLILYELFYNEEAYAYLHTSEPYRPFSVSPGFARPNTSDIDGPSFLPVLKERRIQKLICEYGAIFAIAHAHTSCASPLSSVSASSNLLHSFMSTLLSWGRLTDKYFLERREAVRCRHTRRAVSASPSTSLCKQSEHAPVFAPPAERDPPSWFGFISWRAAQKGNAMPAASLARLENLLWSKRELLEVSGEELSRRRTLEGGKRRVVGPTHGGKAMTQKALRHVDGDGTGESNALLLMGEGRSREVSQVETHHRTIAKAQEIPTPDRELSTEQDNLKNKIDLPPNLLQNKLFLVESPLQAFRDTRTSNSTNNKNHLSEVSQVQSSSFERRVLTNVDSMILTKRDFFYWGAQPGTEDMYGLLDKSHGPLAAVSIAMALHELFVSTTTLGTSPMNQSKEFVDTYLPFLPVAPVSWAYCSHWVMHNEHFARYASFASMFLVALEATWDLRADLNRCPLSFPSGRYNSERCWGFIMERMVDIWAYHSGTRMIFIHNDATTDEEAFDEQFDVTQRSMWLHWFSDENIEVIKSHFYSRLTKRSEVLYDALQGSSARVAL
eukprot:TRINITY_DN1113_c0_g1_i6.p1 TRINITY_DN1113_c0_g1~~TRINITY_DN1113_c0_g1_i6.p1  ORF type:complete len:654 (-),score=33.71 TRINITY_DN1113_c0_g1_i6:170-2131(-)